jgi:hypothetical protein
MGNGVPSSTWLGMAILFGFVLAVFLMAYYEGHSFGLIKKIRCKRGIHIFRSGYKGSKKRYYCKVCRTPRKHPELKFVKGGKKDCLSDIEFML